MIAVIISVYVSGLVLYAMATVLPWSEARSNKYDYARRSEALWSIAVLLAPAWFLATPFYAGWCAILAYRSVRSYFGGRGGDR